MLVDPNAPFFKPLWVRILCVLLPLLWAAMEYSNQAYFWAGLFAVAGIYLAVELFVRRKPD